MFHSGGIMIRHVKKIIKIFALGTFIFIIGTAAINAYIINFAKPYVYSAAEQLPARYTVIVPGAKVYQNGVSHVVRDRIEAAVLCLNAGKAERVLISGDHGRKGYDEVNQMGIFMHRVYGTPIELLFLDHAGFSTYETMYRAKEVFCVDNAIIVTQKFHTARSVYLARKRGINAVAFEAPEVQPYAKSTRVSWKVRESLARVKAFFGVMFNKKPTFLGEQIPITGDAKKTHDTDITGK